MGTLAAAAMRASTASCSPPASASTAPPSGPTICRRCAWLGVELDPARNEAHGPRITTDASRIPVHVIPTDEERMIARHTLALLRSRP